MCGVSECLRLPSGSQDVASPQARMLYAADALAAVTGQVRWENHKFGQFWYVLVILFLQLSLFYLMLIYLGFVLIFQSREVDKPQTPSPFSDHFAVSTAAGLWLGRLFAS